MNQKRTPYRNKKLLAAAQGQQCTLQVPGVCNHDSQTTVAAHSNASEDGKGLGQKADDCFVAFVCSACHDWLDGRIKIQPGEPDDRHYFFHRGMKRTWRLLLDMGVLK